MIVFGVLTINAVIFNRLESQLLSFIFNDYVKGVEKTIDDQGQQMKTALKNRVALISEIGARASASLIYNMDSASLATVLKSYMEFDGVIAIQVNDETGNPTQAAWREKDVVEGAALPENYVKDKNLIATSDSLYEEKKVGSFSIYYSDETINLAMDKEKKKAGDAIASFRDTVDSKFNRATFVQILILACVIVILVLAINRSLFIIMSKPLFRLKNMVVDLVEGEGDLTKRLNVSSADEIGDLAGWFNKFIERMQTLIGDFSQNVISLNASSQNLEGIAENLSSHADTVSLKSTTVASATEEMSSNLFLVAEASEQTTTNVAMVAAATEEMNSTFNEITQSSEKARSVTMDAVAKARKASDRVNELGAAATEINKVTEVITEISEQTNLLALNATIEAARAGEAGKGFAVVANEIKELARQTAEATRDIKNKIDGIQSSTHGAVMEITDISNVIHAVNESVTSITTAVREQDIATREISKNVAEASMGIQKVHENISQSSDVASGIAREIADVNMSARDVAQNSSQVNKGAEELAGIADQLKRQVGRFKI